MSNNITLRQRHAIYETTIKLIELLKIAISRDTNGRFSTVLNDQLLKRLVTAGMLCPGFSVLQKDNIATVAGLPVAETYQYNQPRYADQWVHLHALCPRPGLPVDLLEWYIAVLRDETARRIHNLPALERDDVRRRHELTSEYFGYLWHEIGHPANGKDLEAATLHEAARRELQAIERVIRRTFPTANEMPPTTTSTALPLRSVASASSGTKSVSGTTSMSGTQV
jgi:hypothetical protein